MWVSELLQRVGEMGSDRRQFMFDYWYLYALFFVVVVIVHRIKSN